jgi:D-serine dehydratase
MTTTTTTKTIHSETIWAFFIQSSHAMPALFGMYSTLHKAVEAKEMHLREFPEDVDRIVIKMLGIDKEPCYTPIVF